MHFVSTRAGAAALEMKFDAPVGANVTGGEG
jgi:hypothetical protein